MTLNRDNLIGKISALMAKTTANGCTEHEAMAALDKARAMMDAYEVSEDELRLTKEEKAVLRKEPPGSKDTNNVKSYMAGAIAKFCDCQVWRTGDGLVFCGLRSDAQFATYLMDTLAEFVRGELVNHLLNCPLPKGERRFVINGFIAGATGRISQRLNDLVRQSQAVVSSNSKALTVVKNQAVDAKMKELGLHLCKGRAGNRRCNGDAYRAGKAAGDRASFGRPVSGNGGTARLT